LLESRNDLAHKPSLNPVRLDHYESVFNVVLGRHLDLFHAFLRANRPGSVQATRRARRPNLKFFSHFDEQKWYTVPSRLTNIFPVPSSMAPPQNEHVRFSMISPRHEFLSLVRRLAKHENVADLDGAHTIARDYPSLVRAFKDTALNLFRLSVHPRVSYYFDYFCRRCIVVFCHRTSSKIGY
jgi:hypothetical protein